VAEIVWTRGAESDLQAIYNELEDARPGLGDEFLGLIDAAVELLEAFPEMAPIYDSPFRRLVLKKSFGRAVNVARGLCVKQLFFTSRCIDAISLGLACWPAQPFTIR
jgi:plasmid stabilization system protein ParE